MAATNGRCYNTLVQPKIEARLFVLGLVVMVACTVELSAPPGAMVQCESDAQCPKAMRCQISSAVCVGALDVDSDPPVVVSASAPSSTQVVIAFSEVLADDPTDLAHYAIEPELPMTAAVLGNSGLAVTLFVAPQAAGELYSVTVTDLFDRARNPLRTDGEPAANVVQFTGFGERDTSPPDLISPVEEVLAGRDAISLSWAVRAGASRYTLQLSTSPDFASLLSETDVDQPTTTVTFPDVSRGLPALDEAITYYWRVRANVTEAPFDDDYPVARFDVLTDTVYVSCPPDETCDDADAVGSRTRPLRRIQSGLGAASVHGAARVVVAGRGADQAYEEQVLLADGISLFGGFDPDFVTQDPVAHPTIIENDALSVVSASGLTNATLDGFTIRGSGVTLQVNYGIDVSNVTALTIHRCIIEPREADERSVGINITASGTNTLGGGILVTDSTITSGPAGSYSTGHSNAVRIQESSATFRGNTIVASATTVSTSSPFGEFHSVALRQTNSLLVLDRNTLTAASSSSAKCTDGAVSCASWALFGSGGEMLLTNNVFKTGRSENTGGVVVTNSGLADYINNTFYVDVASSRSYALNQDGDAPLVINNLFVANESNGTAAVTDTSIQDIRFGFVCERNVFVGYPCAYSELPYGANECQTTTAAAILPIWCLDRVDDPDGNTMLTTAEAALPTDLRPDGNTATVIREGAANRPEITVDRDGTARSCAQGGTPCFSIGAFEAP